MPCIPKFNKRKWKIFNHAIFINIGNIHTCNMAIRWMVRSNLNENMSKKMSHDFKNEKKSMARWMDKLNAPVNAMDHGVVYNFIWIQLCVWHDIFNDFGSCCFITQVCPFIYWRSVAHTLFEIMAHNTRAKFKKYIIKNKVVGC